MRTLPATTAILVIGLHGCARVSSEPRAAGPFALGAFAVGERTITLVDTSRAVRFPGRPPEPRTLATVIRYSALGPSSGINLRNAPPARASGRLPLAIFGHGPSARGRLRTPTSSTAGYAPR